MNVAHRLLLLAVMAAAPSTVLAQPTSVPTERGIYLTIFRSPSTGVEIRSGHGGINVGFYPTVIGKNGKRGNANFVRVGGSYYMKNRGPGLYASPSILFSLDTSWKHGALIEMGYRGAIYRRLNGRLGAGMLTTTDGMVRLNPTIGMDMKLGRGR